MSENTNNMNALIVSGSALLSSLIGLLGYLIKINNKQSDRLKRIESSIIELKNEMHTNQSQTYTIERRLTINSIGENSPNQLLISPDMECHTPKSPKTPHNTTVDFSTFMSV
jgi:hypothetical protein